MASNDIVTVGNIGPEFEVGTNIANLITIKVDGTTVLRDATTGELSSPASAAATLSYDQGTSVLMFSDGQGGTTNVNLSALTTDIYVTGGTFDASTGILTLTDPDAGTADVTVNLGALVGVSTDTDNLLIAGTDGKPFVDCAKIKADCTTVCNDAFGNALFNAFAP